MKKKTKSRLRYILLLCCTIIVVLLFFEIVLRIWFYQNPIFHKLHPYYVYTLNPDAKFSEYHPGLEAKVSMEINDLGFNAPLIEYDNQENKKRIMVIGDSFVECYSVGLESCFTTRMQENLGDDYEVLSFGVGSWATDNEYKVLELEGPKYKPEVAVVVFHINDLWTIKRDYIFIEQDGQLIDETPIKWGVARKISYGFAEISHVYRLYYWVVGQHVTLSKIFQGVGLTSDPYNDEKPKFGWNTPLGLFYDIEDQDIEENYEKFEMILIKYKEFTERNSIRLLFVILPVTEQVSDSEYNTRINKGDITESGFTIQLPFERIMVMMDDLKIDYVYPLEALRYEENQSSVYLRGDPHLNSKGNQILAGAILDELDLPSFSSG